MFDFQPSLLNTTPAIACDEGAPTLVPLIHFPRHGCGNVARAAGSAIARRSSSITSLAFGDLVARFEGQKFGVASTENLPTGRTVVLDVAAEPCNGEVRVRR